MKVAVRTLADLGVGCILSPERHVTASDRGSGIALGDLVVERKETADPSKLGRALILDTTHAKDGLVDVASALRDRSPPRSAKKLAHAGDLLISRLRPYLRQIALLHPAALAAADGRPIAVSTEFYVLRPPAARSELAYLLPYLLGPAAQALLAGAQEGGHHPRVPRESLFALRVPESLVAGRAAANRSLGRSLTAFYEAAADVQARIAST